MSGERIAGLIRWLWTSFRQFWARPAAARQPDAEIYWVAASRADQEHVSVPVPSATAVAGFLQRRARRDFKLAARLLTVSSANLPLAMVPVASPAKTAKTMKQRSRPGARRPRGKVRYSRTTIPSRRVAHHKSNGRR